jgi:hypothetical protein
MQRDERWGQRSTPANYHCPAPLARTADGGLPGTHVLGVPGWAECAAGFAVEYGTLHPAYPGFMTTWRVDRTTPFAGEREYSPYRRVSHCTDAPQVGPLSDQRLREE